MTDRDALYRAILASPEDDTPRLVYADWLEENDRAEAEFIRVQCQLEAAPPDHPQHHDLREREEELQLWLTTHVPGPKPKFPAGLFVDGGPRWWNLCRRGFPRFLEFDGQNRPGVKAMRVLAASLERAFASIPTRWLVVRSITIGQLSELLKQPAIAALDRLTIQIGTDEPAAEEAAGLIAACPRLGNLRGAALFPLGDTGAAALAQSENLARMQWLATHSDNLSASGIRSLGSARWFRGLHHLRLQLGLATEAFEEFCRLEPFTRLHTLNLSDTAVPIAAWQTFAGSKAFPRLARLEVNQADLSSGRMAALASASGFNLSSLDLNFSAIGNDGAQALTTATWAGSLRSLSLASNRLTSSGVAAIAGCRKLTQLKRLNLDYNTQGMRGLRAIAGNPAFRNLTTLLLSGGSGRPLAQTHFHEFLQKLNLPLLRQLDLTDQHIGPKAAQLLIGEKFGNLTRLSLGNCKLTDTVVGALLASPTLQNLIELKLGDNKLKTGVKALTDRRVMPRLGACQLTGNRIDPDLARKLARRPGIVL